MASEQAQAGAELITALGIENQKLHERLVQAVADHNIIWTDNKELSQANNALRAHMAARASNIQVAFGLAGALGALWLAVTVIRVVFISDPCYICLL
jgi:hypothetical protein